MTKVQNPIVGRSRGSAGGMTFTKNFGKNVMRTKPFEVSNPKTTAQTTQRDFFKQVQSVTASVTDEQLRSLFGDMPKGMSRRNALSKQIAAAYSIDGTTKSVDFSKLESIGYGEKVTTPFVKFENGVSDDAIILTPAMFNIPDGSQPNLILIVFDSVNNNIIIVNTIIDDYEQTTTADVVLTYFTNLTGFAYVTCARDGSNVSQRDFGSFIIKCRKTKTGQNTKGDTPRAGDVVNLSATIDGSDATLDFGNYNFNNLVPGELYQISNDVKVVLVGKAIWQEGTGNTYTALTAEMYDSNEPTFLEIMQNNNVVDTVPFTVIVE